MFFLRRQPSQSQSFLGSLLRDVRGNTLAIVAASMIPLAGMVGGAVDISRMYLVKTRLQHACDAGALAGRRAMGGGTWAFNNYAARTAAHKFFDANIQENPYGAINVTKEFTESAGKVSGTASAVVPMTLMRVLGKTQETLEINCEAEMRLPNTDVMFVLDTTGSMDSKAVSTDTQTKIQALRTAVKCFYEIVARLDTTEPCVNGTPSGGTSSSIQIRFGFVPYASNVNVGKLLRPEWMANTWQYQTREARFRREQYIDWTNGSAQRTSTSASGEYVSSGWAVINTYYGASGATERPWCTSQVPVNSDWMASTNESGRYSSSTTTNGTTRTTTWYTTQSGYRYEYTYDWRSSDRRCRIQRRTLQASLTHYYRQVDNGQVKERDVFNAYYYAPLPLDVSGLKGSNGWNSSITAPLGTQGANVTLNWDGCIEERQTVSRSSYSPVPAGAKDLDIDLVPDPSDQSTLWGPALDRAVFIRRVQTSWDQMNAAPIETSANYYNYPSYYCPREARKLQEWRDASQFESYVDSLTPEGNTYHDIGLLWGARLASPTGLFRSENEYTAQGGEIERHIIFMTDGEVCTGITDYTAYGFQWLDRRTVDPNVAPTDGCQTTGTLTQQVNARTQAICQTIKNKNMTLWVIWFGASNATVEGMMSNCATPGRFFTARNAASLQETFKQIADQISQLRLTQ